MRVLFIRSFYSRLRCTEFKKGGALYCHTMLVLHDLVRACSPSVELLLSRCRHFSFITCIYLEVHGSVMRSAGGQTHTIAQLLLLLIRQRRVGLPGRGGGPLLVTAGTNVAVDNILRKLLQASTEQSPNHAPAERAFLRVG